MEVAMRTAGRTAGSILGIALAAALGACAHNNAAQGTAQTPEPGQASASSASCPLAKLQGVRLVATNTRDGVAITFAAPQGEVDQLRQNVRDMAEANDRSGDAFASCPCSMTGKAV